MAILNASGHSPIVRGTIRPPGAASWLWLWVSLCTAFPIHAAEEYQIKAAFLYNFIKYVTWPSGAFPAADSPYVIGVVGKDPFGDRLDELARQSLKGRLLKIVRLDSGAPLVSCHLLFVPDSEKKKWDQIFNRLGTAPVLTVGEGDRFALSGGVINFYTENNRVRFEINVDAARRAELTIDSAMLNLAKLVRDPRP